jgi:MFS family permease
MPDNSQEQNKKSIRAFAWASFLNDLGSDMIYPIWPLFVTTVMGANMAMLGLIDGLGEAFVSISKAISGYISDRMRKRKFFIWSGYILGSLSRIGYALAPTWQWLIPFKILDRSGKIRSAPRDALITDISTNQTRGGYFGLIKAMDNLGAVCGVIVCLLIFERVGFTNLFILAAAPSLLSAWLIYKFIRENKARENHGSEPQSKLLGIIPSAARDCSTYQFHGAAHTELEFHNKLFAGFKWKDLTTNFKLFLFLNSVFSLGAFSYSFLLVYAGKSGFTAVYLPVFYLIITVTAALFSLPMGKLSDKVGRKKIMYLAFFFWAAICISFIYSTNSIVVTGVFILYGLHKAALETIQKTYAAELSPDSYRASGLGIFQMAIGVCALPASLIAGFLWDKINMHAPFYLSLSLTLAACALLMFVKEERCNAG